METLLEALAAPQRQARSLEETAHRPWPLPNGSWTLGQTWDDLLFAHWRVDKERLRPLVPSGLEVEEHEGSAWLAVAPFRVVGFRLRGTLPLPRISQFPELNVRTYVTDGHKPGIWFFSLDAASRVAVEGARATYKLPYHHAHMRAERRGDWIHYESARGDAHGVAFAARYRPTGDPFNPQPGTLEHFLTERYGLYADDRGRIRRADIHHAPWDLQAAEAEIDLNTMAPVELPDDEPLLHFSRRQDVVIWSLEP